MWDEAGDSDDKTNYVDNVKDENAYLCILDIDVQCEMRQVTEMIKEMMLTMCRWECLPVYSRHWCPVWDEVGDSDDKTNDVDDVQVRMITREF